MSRPLPTTFDPLDVLQLASVEPIKAGASGSHVGPQDIAHNIHYLYGIGHRPVIVMDTFNSATIGYINGEDAGREEIAVIYARQPTEAPFTSYQITALYENTSGSDAGVIRVELGSDPWAALDPGTSVDLAAAAGSGKWTAVSGTMGADTTQTLDTIRVWVNNGASGIVRLHSLILYPVALGSIDAGSETVSGIRFVPHDTNELDAGSPWSIHQADTMNANLEHIRRVRKDTIVSSCSRLQQTSGDGPLQEESSSYVTHARIPFTPRPGQSLIRWAIYGYRTGTEGKVRLRVAADGVDEYSSQEVTLQATWDASTAYSAAQHDYADGGQAALSCIPGKLQTLEIDVQGDGSDEARLYSVCAWYQQV